MSQQVDMNAKKTVDPLEVFRHMVDQQVRTEMIATGKPLGEAELRVLNVNQMVNLSNQMAIINELKEIQKINLTQNNTGFLKELIKELREFKKLFHPKKS